MTVKVRPLTAADAVAFRHVRLEALEKHPEAYGSVWSDWERKPLSAYVTRIETSVIFGLFTDRGLEGLLAYSRETGNARHRATLTAAYVRETQRGSGAIDALVAAAVSRAQSDGVGQLELMVSVENHAALAAYARAGFKRMALWPRAFCINGKMVDEVLMILPLDD